MTDIPDRRISSLSEFRRRAAVPSREVAVCVCGGEWFVLRGRAGGPDAAPHGAVAMTASGRVTGYAGEPVCLTCGTPWAPAGGWLFV